MDFMKEVIDNQPNTRARCKKDYRNWAIAAILPVVVCIIFALFVWWREEDGCATILLPPMVLNGLYSQYRAVKIIMIGLGKWPGRHQDDWINFSSINFNLSSS